ncbi:MAG: phosphate signaling complex protein PhoU [Candidatus Thorarchaeota archaeon]|jgi:phosphate transport system protein
MTTQLERHIEEIGKRLDEMHQMSSKAFLESMKSFKDLDFDKAASVKKMSEDIEETGAKIEDSIFDTIARRQPVARDLRTLSTYLHVSRHLYRVGRYAFKIAHIVELCEGIEHFKELISLPYMADLAKKTLAIAMNATIKRDLSKIDELEKMEAESDRETEEMFQEITEYLRKRTDITKMAMFYVIVGRYCERAADHAFSIAERAVYMVTGKRKKLGLAYKDESKVGPH